MRETYTRMVEESTPGRFEGESPMTAYVHELFMNGDFGDDEINFGDCDGVNRYGKRILGFDSNGFVSLRKFDSVEEASARLDNLRRGMAEEDREEPTSGPVCHWCNQPIWGNFGDGRWRHIIDGTCLPGTTCQNFTIKPKD